MSINKRMNFASFLAKLCAAGIRGDKLCGWCEKLELLEAGSASQELAMLARGIKNNMAV
jgi:hypothetical protein